MNSHIKEGEVESFNEVLLKMYTFLILWICFGHQNWNTTSL